MGADLSTTVAQTVRRNPQKRMRRGTTGPLSTVHGISRDVRPVRLCSLLSGTHNTPGTLPDYLRRDALQNES